MRIIALLIFCWIFLISCKSVVTPGTGGLCDEHTYCEVLTDANNDGEITDDLRLSRNRLLYASGASAPDTIYIYPPSPGSYTWTGTVHFCGDDSFKTAPPGDSSEPDCDGTSQIPTIKFAGDWSQVIFKADCANGSSIAAQIFPCLHLGDLYAGASEPRIKVRSESRMVFHHVDFPIDVPHPDDPTGHFPIVVTQMIPAVWLDGVENSTFNLDFQVLYPWSAEGPLGGGEPTPSTGTGMYVSAINSEISVKGVPGPGLHIAPKSAIVIDGEMSGSYIYVENDFEFAEVASNGQPIINVGTGGIVFYGAPDRCGYGPHHPNTNCEDFTIYADIATRPGELGSDGMIFYGGNNITVVGEIRNFLIDHIAIKHFAPNGTVHLKAKVVHDGRGFVVPPPSGQGHAGIAIAGIGAHLILDGPLVMMSNQVTGCGASAGATSLISYGPNYSCEIQNPWE